MGEVRQRKKKAEKEPAKDPPSDGDKEKKDKKNDENIPKKMGFWTYCISPLLATLITVSTNSFLDNQISQLENQLVAVSGRIDQMSQMWSKEIARDMMEEIDSMNKTFVVAKASIKEYVSGEFTDFGDPVSMKVEINKLLEDIRKIKAQEDEHYKVLAAERKVRGKTETLMERLITHRQGLIASTKIVQKAYEEHTETIDENELGEQYVNFTAPVEQLRTEISAVLDQCREMGKKRFIATHLMERLDGQLDEAINKVKRGDFDDIPDPIQQSAELWPLFEEFTGFRKDVYKFDNFSQTMRDKFELIADNERFGKNEHIRLGDQYGTPRDYEKIVKKMQEYVTMPSMKELVGIAKGVEKTASDMYVVGCQEETRRVIMRLNAQLDKDEERLKELTKKKSTTEWREAFEEKLVADIQTRQEGLERFVNRMKFQLIQAEEKFANIYYQFLQNQRNQLENVESTIEIVDDDSEEGKRLQGHHGEMPAQTESLVLEKERREEAWADAAVLKAKLEAERAKEQEEPEKK